MLVLKSKEPFGEECLTVGEYTWRVHYLRSLVLTYVYIGEIAFYLETFSLGLA